MDHWRDFDLVWVGREVEQQFGRLGLIELDLGFVQLTAVKEISPFAVDELQVTVVVLKSVRIVGLEAAHILPVPDPERADLLILFVEAVCVPENSVALGNVSQGNAVTKKRGAVHSLGDFNVGEVEHGGAKVDEAHESAIAAAEIGINQVLEVFRDTDNERNVEAGFVGVALASRHHTAVISEVKDEGVFEHSALFQFGDGCPDDVVDHLNAIEVVGPSVAKERSVREVGLKHDFFGIVGSLLVLIGLFAEVEPTFLRLRMVLHVKKRLSSVRAVAPGGFGRGSIPGALGFDGVVILLGLVRGVV